MSNTILDKLPTPLSSAPDSDTGQVAIPVRVISQLGAGTGGAGGAGDASAANQTTEIAKLTSIDSKLTSPITVTGALTDTQLRATAVPVSGPLTDTQIRATALPVSGAVSVSNFPATQAVTIATMPSTPVTGPLTDTQLRATAVPVSGTFFQSTQPVSIAATVGVSGPLTDTQLRASAVPVSGTFFQSTQPVSIAATVAVSGPLTDTQLRATAVPVSGPLTDTQIRASALPVSGTVTAAQATAANLNATVAQSGTWTVQPGNTANTTAWLVTGAALTKGTQGATGFSVQDFKDSGRNVTNYFMAAQVVSTAGEVLQSLTGYKGGIAVGATTTPAVVTSGKTYRVTSLVITYVAIATAGAIQVNLRANLSGVAALSSPLVNSWLIGAPAAVAGVTQTAVIDFPDGLEFAAGTGLGLSVLGVGATGSAAIVGYAKLAMNGFEY